MGFQHLTSEQRSEIASRGGRAVWANLTEEEKEEKLRNSFLSDEAKLKSLEGRSEALKKSWDRLSLEERQARVEAAAEGVRGASQQKSESMSRYWAGLGSEERYERYRGSFGSDESKRKVAEALQVVWDSYTPEEKMARINRTLNSEEARENWKRTWGSKGEEEKKGWIKVHLRGRRKPSEPEIWLGIYLEESYPGEWAYNGDGSQGVTIGGKVPDFININGKKAVIEVFGTYWHGEDEVEEKIKHYRKFGFKCFILWEYECYLWGDLEKIFGGQG